MTSVLTDRFNRKHTYLRISVTDRCNLRCFYCMPTEGIVWKEREEILTYEEIIRMARIFVSLGVDKIRLTGGEPTIRHHIEQLIQGLSEIDGLRALLMTTNGVTLKEKALAYKKSGLTGINISLDTLRPERFKTITRSDYFNNVLAGIDSALSAGFDTVKLNVVVMSGINDDEILDFVNFVKDTPLNVRFIEYMPFKDNGWHQAGLVPYARLKSIIEEHYLLIPIQTEASAVAKDFSLAGYPGTVSFVTSMSDSFCGTCNRIRLTAEGAIKPCLFDATEVNIRHLLRQNAPDEVLIERIAQALSLKPEAHPPMETLAHKENRCMIQIGG